MNMDIHEGHRRPGWINFKLLNFKEFLMEERSEVSSS